MKKPFSFRDPTHLNNEFHKQKLKELYTVNPDAAILTSLYDNDLEDFTVTNSETDTADETELNSIPEPLTSLFEPQLINNNPEEIQSECREFYYEYKNGYCDSQYKNLTKVIREQRLSTAWQIHRAGRITASVSKRAYSLNLNNENSKKKFTESIMQYSTNITVRAQQYGIDKEAAARKKFVEVFTKNHENVIVKETGLHVSEEYPFMGASSDALVLCKCHGLGVLEIKCPYKYSSGLDDVECDKTFPTDWDGNMKTNHQYYFQIQQQMIVTNTKFGYFFVWSDKN
ncbi:uncharacterized protein LOC130654781 isoform X2 [Hydractinia symbiolongicarpus]|uniref:uncharacterized protein LOC130654781 isoform X2 n=1 Tax=Hydractinia symbiolongicarpus TaxID=13093 RepID=UPI00254E5558|nr:uncharacterized protein LOC130654781 isoform X2 [Hydractinia symbiolongicarpus]XP_057313388.1 uncharacterized protein LOC130654781 isoform X2 [Hydractinia symbiolongicarpus]